MNPLDELLHPPTGGDSEQWAYWCEVSRLFLERYNIELGLGNAYGGHLAILLRAAYDKGKKEQA